MGGGGMGGGGMGGGGARPHRGRGQGSAGGTGGNATALSAERAAEVKSALERAFSILDPTQQDAARKLLATHDVDVDTGSSAPAEPAPASENEP